MTWLWHSGWILVLAGLIWVSGRFADTMVPVRCLRLVFFAHRDVEYANEFWWLFSHDGSVPRFFLLAWPVLAIVIVCYGLWRLLSVAVPYSFAKPSAAEVNQARQLLSQAEHTHGFLALLGDKCLLWNSQCTAFLMVAATPQFRIAMRDPLGDTADLENLLYAFQEHADQ